MVKQFHDCPELEIHRNTERSATSLTQHNGTLTESDMKIMTAVLLSTVTLVPVEVKCEPVFLKMTCTKYDRKLTWL